MGIPRFYRWMSERYPQINQQISDVSLLPEFDNLYLDLNGIIHQCTHPSDEEVSEELGEAHHIPAIFAYIDRIVTHIVKPKKLLFLAVDGVAPRAKLNQQRSRRFRAGKELYEKRLKESKGDDNDEGSPKALFDSNCITPGTEFMYRLSSHLQYFIRKKLKEDPSWRNLTVIFSGQEVPGEGEHKIVEYIRRTKMQPGYPPNVRHCMYGSDADLMLLGLMTHEPHFTLVREVVNFGGSRKSDNSAKKIVARQTKEQAWQLVHLSLLRQYLSIELNVQVAWFDAERALDDFIFLTFLLGNDFIPHSPTLDISEDAIALMLQLYRDLLPDWGDFLTEGGVLKHPKHLEALCRVVGSMEEQILTKRADEERKFRERKRYGNGYGRGGSSPTRAGAREVDENDDDEDDFESELLAAMADQSPAPLDDDVVVLSGSPEFQATKWAYYQAKFGVKDSTPQLLHAIKVAYVEALVWCAGYYFQGVPSWSWFYPFHYSPMLSDLTDIADIVSGIRFEVGAPFLPFQQLLSTLPPTSASLVPPGYQHLMVDPNSPIARFYPIQFEIDMDGKRNEWEGVNVLPFIDASMLLDAIAAHCPDAHLTDLERLRNQAGSAYTFSHDIGAMDTVHSTLPGVLDDIPLSHSRRQVYHLPPLTNFRCTLTDGVEMPLAGFPSIYSLPLVSSEIKSIGVNCFGMSSKKPTLVLAVEPRDPLTLDQAKQLLGTTVFVNYPNLHEAQVDGVSTEQGTCELTGDGVVVEEHTQAKQAQWSRSAFEERKRYLTGRGLPGTGGVEIGAVTCLLHVRVLQGMMVDPSTGATHKKFGKAVVKIPYQLAVLNQRLVDLRFEETAAQATPERFPIDSPVVLVHGPSKGLTGVVVGHNEDTVSVRVPKASPEPPFGYAIAQAIADKYYSSYVICQKLGIQPGTLGRVTGSLLVNPGRYDIGLNMKLKKELTLAGYCRYQQKAHAAEAGVAAWTTGDSVSIVGSDADTSAANDKDGAWEYSDKAFYTILAYQRKFPQVFAALDKLPYSAVYDGTTFLGVPQSSVKSLLESIKTWLSQLDIAPLPLIPISSDTLPRAAIKAIEKAGDIRVAQTHQAPAEDHVIVVEPTALFRNVQSNYDLSSSAFAQRPPRLGDRVVNLSARGVPFGLRGTVVATHQATACVEVLFDAKFSGGTSLSGSCSQNRGKLVQWASLLVVSTPPANDHQPKPRAPKDAPANASPVPKKAPAAAPKAQQKAPPQPAPPAATALHVHAAPTTIVAPPPPPSNEKMHLLISKWAKAEETKSAALDHDLSAPANSMAQYFSKLQAGPAFSGPAFTPPLPTGPPLPPQAAAAASSHFAPPLPAQGQRVQPAAAAAPKKSSGLLLPAQVMRSKLSKDAQS